MKHLFAAGLLLGTVLAAEAVPFTFTNTGSMQEARLWHSATLLRNGKVLVAGGGVAGEIGSAEIYDPTSGAWTTTGSLLKPRAFHSATLLPNGKVLVAAGLANSGGTQTSAELYDPATGVWSATGSLRSGREYHTASLLPNGKVLVAGGSYLASAELYDPATATWTFTGSMSNGREAHSATLLLDGRVLVVGGRRVGSIASAEIYDPATGVWSAAGTLAAARANHSATLLPSGKVLVAGGFDYGTGKALASAEIYDPASNSWSTTSALATARSLHTGTLLPDGRVLVGGGIASNSLPLASAQIYTPATGTWSATGSLKAARTTHTATLLPDSNVLFAGGDDTSARALASAELFLTDGPATTLRNISSRLQVLTGDKILIGGFIITGTAPKKVIVRALGPSLGARGVAGALADPVLELIRPDGSSVLNDNWTSNRAEVAATTLAPERDEEAAIVETLAPGAYTALVTGHGNTTGVGLVEVYDLDPAAGSVLANISTRGLVQSGENVLIGGFILRGSSNLTRVVLRGIGPSLAETTSLTDVLADPVLDLRDANGARLLLNDDWQSDADAAAELVRAGLAPRRAEEAALFTALPAGNFTVILSGKNGGSGIAVVEAYNVR